MKIKEVHIDLFSSYTFVFYDCTALEAGKYIEKNFKGLPKRFVDWLKDEDNGLNQGVCLTDVGKSPNAVIWINSNLKNHHGIELLAHEASHAAYRIMQHWGMSIGEVTQEINAMLTGHIVGKVLKKKKRKRKSVQK